MTNQLHILIIDDDDDDYFITSKYLEEISSFKITCQWCYSIAEAEEKLRSNAYDLYFLDYKLGAKTGLELLKSAVENGCKKPIILLTGKGTAEIDRQAVELGAYDFLVKSELGVEKLERSLRFALERYRSFKIINDNEKKFRLIFENAISFIFTCNNLLYFSECNPASEFLLGYQPSELKNKSFLSIVADSDKDKLIPSLQERKNIYNKSIKLIHKDGSIKTGNINFNHFDDVTDEVHWQGIIYDETLRIQAEEAKLKTEKLEATHRLVRTL